MNKLCDYLLTHLVPLHVKLEIITFFELMPDERKSTRVNDILEFLIKKL